MPVSRYASGASGESGESDALRNSRRDVTTRASREISDARTKRPNTTIALAASPGTPCDWRTRSSPCTEEGSPDRGVAKPVAVSSSGAELAGLLRVHALIREPERLRGGMRLVRDDRQSVRARDREIVADRAERRSGALGERLGSDLPGRSEQAELVAAHPERGAVAVDRL